MSAWRARTGWLTPHGSKLEAFSGQSNEWDGFIDTIKDAKLKKLLSCDDGHETTAAHRAWMNEQNKATLSKKARGEMKYTSLDDVRREFGFDAVTRM
ncbi:hypothetical protein [Hoeflea sp.]|uniref:hypothetical protein n=1 Tax=Hoeflea sp. TaxID=1940281 RepID=UPI00198AD5D9|nr:hypothetical protein [Hoeflea sp.]MBC7284480.1 hypothetical protein [Hoeflea sp.]